MRVDPPQLSVLLEHGNGVMEVFFGILKNDDAVTYYPISSVPRSGRARPTDRQQLNEAVNLLQWADDHAGVFEGRVSQL